MYRRDYPPKPKDVFEAPYYTATLVFPDQDKEALAKTVARKMRLQNAQRPYYGYGRYAPVSFKEVDDGYELVIMSKPGGELEVKFNDPEGGWESAPTKSSIESYLKRFFGVPAEARELFVDTDNEDECALIDTFCRRMQVKVGSFIDYPQTSDVLMAGSLDFEGIAEASEFVGTSPYYMFTATSKRTTDQFEYDPEDYFSAFRSVMRNAQDEIVVESVFENGEGRIVARGYGRHWEKGFSRPSAPANDSCADPIEYYLDSDVELQLFQTSVATPDDILAVERIVDFINFNGAQQVIDFRLKTEEEADETHRKTMERMDLTTASDDKSSTDLFGELIGLEDIKAKAVRYVKHLGVKARKSSRMPSPHLLMMGNPGTGKTTMARAIAQALYEEGLIASPSNFVEASRSDLVSQYVGGTAIKTGNLINRARHGVLFIDEAYALYGGDRDSFGAEAIATLVKEMEDCLNDYERKGFVCIMAGYTGPMEQMLGVNPGLRDRFAHRLDFRDYDLDELLSIFYKDVDDLGLSIAPEARSLAEDVVMRVYEARDDNFANARIVRKLTEHIEMLQIDLRGDENVVDLDVVKALREDADVRRMMTVTRDVSKPQALAFM